MKPLTENKPPKPSIQVIHVRQMQPGDVYIGRSCYGYIDSGWGNPFKIRPGQNREQVIAQYRKWLVQQPQLMARLQEPKGKRLACWCKPHPCHGDVLAGLVD